LKKQALRNEIESLRSYAKYPIVKFEEIESGKIVAVVGIGGLLIAGNRISVLLGKNIDMKF
jgi:D-arabinose 1-dehydrogenase-like Zn-dependent alcohol dehydrogenase